jgi:hypothetical protein
VEREGATPKPEAKEIMELHLLLGEYAYEAGDMERAAECYKFACTSEDAEQAKKGQVGHFKARLSWPNAEGTRQLLKSILAEEGGERTMARVLKMIAWDGEHDTIMSKMFTVAKGDPDLLKDIVRAMETATAKVPVPDEDRTADFYPNDCAEDEARGVLLYDLGVAVHTYKVSADDTEPVSKALRLWRDSRDLLSNVHGGRNASVAWQNATTALANHYFQIMVDGKHLDHVYELVQLAGAESNIYDEATGFLGALHALCGNRAQARAALSERIQYGLQILSDDTPENDAYGFSIIYKTLGMYQDFRNAGVALSLLGQPDLVAGALCFEARDIQADNDVDKQRVLDTVTALARQTIEATWAQVPDVSQQAQRIQAAKAHLDSLMMAYTNSLATATAAAKLEAEDEDGEAQDDHSKGGGLDLETTTAHHLLHTRLSVLQLTHTPELNTAAFQWQWSCDGYTPDGKRCSNITDFENPFYHCMYCRNRDFCGACLVRLRTPSSGAKITVCSSKHRWLRIPRQGSDMFVGLGAKGVRVPRVRPVEGDDHVLEFIYDEDGEGVEVTVEAWRVDLAKEWEIPLDTTGIL